MSKIDLVSLKFSPGLMKEVLFLKECFDLNDCITDVFLHERYKRLADEANENITNVKYQGASLFSIIRRYLSLVLNKKDLIIFYNSHPVNVILLFCSALFSSKKKRALVLHEPSKEKPFKNYGKYGFVVLLIELLNKIQSWLCTDVVVLSPHALQLYKKSFGYNRYCDLHEARILLPIDKQNSKELERKYFSFFGSVVATKKIDWFLDLVEFSVNNNSQYQFLIVTSSKLPTVRIDSLKSKGAKLKVVNPAVLTDPEIGNWLNQSIAVFSMHKSVTQSGVFVECMRHHTPVICLDEPGFSQFIDDCGVLVSDAYDTSALYQSMNKIFTHQLQYSKAASEVYHKNFSAEKFISLYGPILQKISAD